MATTEPGISTPASPSAVGRHLRAVRKAKGLSRAEVARSAGLTRRELAAYERGKSPVPDSDLWCLAGSCGVDVSELLPSRDRLTVGSDLAALTVGESVRRLRTGTGSDGVLREYLAMIYELRNLPPGTRAPMREEDLATLADALGGTPDAIEARLHELIGASREEAARLRSLILPPRPLPAPASPPSGLPDLTGFAAPGPADAPTTPSLAPPPPPPVVAPPVVAVPMAAPEPAIAPEYPPPAFDFAAAPSAIGDPEATDRFFDAPRVDDPFAPPPPLTPLAPLAGLPPLDGAEAGTAAPPGTAPLGDPTAALAFPPPGADFPAGPAAFAAPPMPWEGAGEPGEPVDPFAPAPSAPAGPLAFGPPASAPLDPFAPPSGPPLAADPPNGEPLPAPVVAAQPDTEPVPDFWGEPADGAPVVGFADLAADPFAADHLAADPFAATPLAEMAAPPDSVEMVVLEPAVTGAPDPGTVPSDAAHDVDEGPAATADATSLDGTDDADPFAVLRVPLPETDLAGADTESVAGGTPDLVADPPVDPFADAFAPADGWPEPRSAAEIVEIPELDDRPGEAVEAVGVIDVDPAVDGPDEEPTDEWFDRAAAAADALIAETVRAESAGDAEPEEPHEPRGEPTESVDALAPIDALEPLDAIDALDDDFALAEAEPPALEPIVWSLQPPVAADAIAVPALAPTVAPEAFVAAGTDWQVGGIFPATAMADDGTLALRRADVRWALADLIAAEDFTVRATVNFTSGAGFGILFRVSTDDSERITGYSFDVDPIYSGGGFLLRQWNDSRQHWKPLAHAPVADSTRLYGTHTIEVSLRVDQLVASVDDEVVLTVDRLSRCSLDSGREPCRGNRLGVQAWSTTEVTVDRLLLANH